VADAEHVLSDEFVVARENDGSNDDDENKRRQPHVGSSLAAEMIPRVRGVM
jgi:hypothetical protein